MQPPGSRLVAHTPAAESDVWHYLDDHSRSVAAMAATFAEPFDQQDIARLLGLLHDVGKASVEFQEYLFACAREPKRKQPTVDHKTIGALLVGSRTDLSQILLGHHGGLTDPGEPRNRHDYWMHHKQDQLQETLRRFLKTGIDLPSRIAGLPDAARHDSLCHEFLTRMLFSCLVDADALDTEAHWQPEAGTIRTQTRMTLVDLWNHFLLDQERLGRQVQESGLASTQVNRVRASVYNACVEGASLPPGLFRLTVPTGGGKTRSATAFALRHGIEHGLRRVIYAVPFLTITEQTVDVLRSALGDQASILEHHSGIEPKTRENDDGAESADEQWRRLVSDNWDAPIVVTTTVQLFESLFARKTRKCRKLHNIASSVIILDEFQTVPEHLREPIFDVLSELVSNYGVTVVLCTATQPVLDTIETELTARGMSPRELAPDPAQAFRALNRVRITWPTNGERWSWDRVAGEMRATEQVLTIVNTVRDAGDAFSALSDPNAFHLSTRLCGAHRRAILREIRCRLRDGKPCRVISTQLVEAGVDLDFPAVMRALGPLDRIAQAAGRCNREGRMSEKGRVIVFDTEDQAMPSGAYRHGAGITETMLREGLIDFSNPTTFDSYFRRLYADRDADTKQIQQYRRGLDFPEVDERFRMIDDNTFPVFIAWNDEAIRARDDLEAATRWKRGSLRQAFRRIQPYLVACRSYEHDRFESGGLLNELHPGLWEWLGDYDDKLGLIQAPDARKGAHLDPIQLFV